jgi:hypothetical protein
MSSALRLSLVSWTLALIVFVRNAAIPWVVDSSHSHNMWLKMYIDIGLLREMFKTAQRPCEVEPAGE